MCKDLQFFRRFRRQVLRIQGYIKTQVIREAFEELCQATRVIQKYGRRRIYYNLYRTVTEEMKPKEEGEVMDKSKVQEAMHKALTKLNPSLNFFAPETAESSGKGKSRKRRSVGSKGAGIKADLGDDPTMPRFRTRHKGWLHVKFGRSVDKQCYVHVRLGMVCCAITM